MIKKKILFSAPYDFLLEDLQIFQDEYDIDFYEIWKVSDIPTNSNIYDIWIPNPGQNFIIEGKVLDSFESLKIISTPSTGINHISIEDCKKRNIKVFGLMDQRDGLNEISASAEFTFLKILSSLRKIRFSWSEVEQDRWRENEADMRGSEINEKNFGLIGMGRIGNHLTRYLEAFNAKSISFYDVNVNRVSSSANKTDLENIFQLNDVIVLCVALNFSTEKMINYELLSKLKINSHLINTSRGEIIDEEGLIRILGERSDINFSTDVLSGEVNNGKLNKKLLELHKKNRINITPHIAGATLGSQKKAAMLAFNILKQNV